MTIPSSPSEALYTLALLQTPGIGSSTALRLYRAAGNATEIFTHRQDIRTILPEATDLLVRNIRNLETALGSAQQELDYAAAHQIRVLCPDSPDYPVRLHQCDDAPLLLFCAGTADLNARRVVSVVGTRHITEYGKQLCQDICTSLAELYPQTLVVSGLAYGVDIHAHRACLEQGLPTVGVLAHGLDTLYPPSHRETANRMVAEGGGLLTEYVTKSRIGKENFVRRNRIVAGMTDATIVVESARKGGGLITAELAQGYNREVFACPGRLGDEYSEGCNKIIANNVAGLFTGIENMGKTLGWPVPSSAPVQQELFPELPPEEAALYRLLDKTDIKTVNQIVLETSLPVQRITSLLFNLEIKGLVKSTAGNGYRRN